MNHNKYWQHDLVNFLKYLFLKKKNCKYFAKHQRFSFHFTITSVVHSYEITAVQNVGNLQEVWIVFCKFLPGSLSSSQDRSSELISERLGVGLKSSESESASSAVSPLLWLRGAGSGGSPRKRMITAVTGPLCWVTKNRRTKEEQTRCELLRRRC